jgi:hypothetical protein
MLQQLIEDLRNKDKKTITKKQQQLTTTNKVLDELRTYKNKKIKNERKKKLWV